jgi:hypothetical protein
MPQRRKRIIPVLAQKMSGEARRVSLLAHALHELRLALRRLSREIFVCLAILICLWHALAGVFSQLWRLLF